MNETAITILIATALVAWLGFSWVKLIKEKTKLFCHLGIHEWKGCLCSKCGKSRDQEHDWSKDCERCAACPATRTDVHEWKGCICSKCGKTRDQEHDWSRDCEKCAVCCVTRSDAHEWDGCICKKCCSIAHEWKNCQCTKCGEKRDQDHAWKGCKCSICGASRDEEHAWVDGICSICGKEDLWSIVWAQVRPGRLDFADENQIINLGERVVPVVIRMFLDPKDRKTGVACNQAILAFVLSSFASKGNKDASMFLHRIARDQVALFDTDGQTAYRLAKQFAETHPLVGRLPSCSTCGKSNVELLACMKCGKYFCMTHGKKYAGMFACPDCLGGARKQWMSEVMR